MLLDGPNHVKDTGRRFLVFFQEVHLLGPRRKIRRHGGNRPAHFRQESLHLALHLRVSGFRTRRGVGQANQARGVFQRIEDHEDAADHEFAEKLLLAHFHAAHTIEGRNDLIIEIPDEAAVGQRDILAEGGRTARLHILFQRVDGVAVDALHQVLVFDHQAVLERLQADERFRADERVPRQRLAAGVHRFKQESLRIPDELVIDRDGRVEVDGDLRAHGDQRRCLRAFLVFVKGGAQPQFCIRHIASPRQ